MVATPTTSAAPNKTVSPRHALLEELIGIALKHAGEQYLALASKLAGALIDATDGDTRLIQQRIRAGNQLRNRNFAFLHLASSALERALRRELAELAPAARREARAAAQPLSLVPFEEMDHKVALSGVSKPFESLHADALQTLNVRLAFLLDRDILRGSQNPFRPAVFLQALQQAWVEFDTEEASAELLLPWIKPGMFIELGPMLDALNLALQAGGVLPGGVDRYQRRKSDGGVAVGAAKTNQAALAQQLRQFFASSEVAGSAAGQIVDGIASGMLQGAGGVDLTIPDLPAAALAARSTWTPNADLHATRSQPAGGSGAPGPAQHATRGQPAGSAGAPSAAQHVTRVLPAGGSGSPGATLDATCGRSAGGTTPEVARHAMRGQLTDATGGQRDAAAAGAGVGETAVAGGAAGAESTTGDVVARGATPIAGIAAGASWTPGAAQGFHAGALPNEDAQRLAQIGARQPLLAYLAELQKAVPYESIGNLAAVTSGASAGNVFYLPALKHTMPQGSLTRADESTIDLLSAVFDTVFRDPGISPEIRELIRFLQIPVLQAALVDKNFFFQEAHPARRLLELLSRMGWEQRKGPDDPLFQAMQRSVDRVGRDDQHELSVFTDAVNELEALILAEEQAATAAIAAPIAAALRQEKRAESNKLAKNAVALRIGSGEVIAVIEAFLEQRWVSVLTIAYSIEDEKPGAVNNATNTMDDLIWSVRPKLTADDRKQLIARLPGLLSALNKWLDVIRWQDADRLQFFAELAECHASIVRAPLEMSPARQVEIAMQVAQRAAERRLALQARADAERQARPPEDDDPAAIAVDHLERGMWLAFEQEDGSSRKVKLAWISPRRTLYIFSTAARQEAFSMPGDELARRFRDGSAQVVHAEGIVAVALSQALSRAAENDPAMASAAIGPA
ncbi:hypothetical protein FHW58_000995 [Duganella sp. 1224]|uniref:DUF1631 family protein n=1 Tax=Duganella sp. 1224 TaxID=2587052 RepID=UPI0015C745A9|nr:DUF1631 family protein [Duganella sp. 1224]NYE59843.1 hypothetical protein [Duganella sp. 1224]